MDISSFYACEGVGLRGKQHNAVFRGSVPDTGAVKSYAQIGLQALAE